MKKLFENKKGATRTTLVISYVLMMVLIAVFFVTVYDQIVEAQVAAKASTTSRDIGSLIEVTYAAPGDLSVDYETPIDPEGWGSVGSLLLNGEKAELKTHPFNEDGMYTEISSRALTAWFSGVFMKFGKKAKDALKERRVKRARDRLGGFHYDTHGSMYDEVVDTYLPWGESSAYDNLIQTKGGGELKNIVGSERATGFLSTEVAQNPQIMSILKSDPKNAAYLADIADAAPRHRASKIKQMFKGNDEALNFLLDTKGKVSKVTKNANAFFEGLSEETSVRRWFSQVKTKKPGTYDDFIKTLDKAFGNTEVVTQFQQIAHGAETGDLAKLAGTRGGQEALATLKRDPEMASWVATKGDDFYKTSQGQTFLDFSGELSHRRYKKIVDAVGEASGKKNPVKYLRGRRDVMKAIDKAGAAGRSDEIIDSLVYVSKDDELVRILAGKTKLNWRKMYRPIKTIKNYAKESLRSGRKMKESRRVLMGEDQAKMVKGLAESASKSDEAADAIKSTKQLGKLDESSAMLKAGRERGIIGRSARNVMTAAKAKASAVYANRIAGTAIARAGAKVTNVFSTGIKAGSSVFLEEYGFQKCTETGGPVAKAVCYSVGVLTFTVLLAADFVFVTLPLSLMIYEGHRASKQVEAMASDKYEWVSDGTTIYADPPNCDSDVKNKDWGKEIGGGYKDWWQDNKKLKDDIIDKATGSKSWNWYDYIPGSRILRGIFQVVRVFGPIFGEIANAFPGYKCTGEEISTPVKHHSDTEGACFEKSGQSACPNIYISQTSNLGTDMLGGIFAGAPLASTTYAGILSAGGKFGWAVVVYAGTYTYIGITMTLMPQWMVPWFTGSDIYPHDEWWYAGDPVVLRLDQRYDETSGETEVSIDAGEIK